MNIIFLIDSLHSIAAGSERQIYKLISGLVTRNHKVSLVVLRHTDFTSGLKHFPCQIDSLEIKSIASINAIKSMMDLRNKIIRERVDVVHAYFPDACILAPLFLKTSGNTLFTSRRDMGLIYQGKPAWIYRLLAPRTDAIISNSQAVSDLVSIKEKLPSKKRQVIYNGMEKYAPLVDNNPSIFHINDSVKLILVANIKPVKRTLDAVKAVAELINAGCNLELTLMGEHQDPAYVKKIVEAIQNARVEPRIHLTGSINEPRRLLPQADIGLLVSESEGLSNTIMEYMDAGLPVIATRVGGNPELVVHERTGLLVEKGDTEQLKAAIQLLTADIVRRRFLGNEGKLLIQQEFSVDSLILKHEVLYRSKGQTQ